MENLSRVAALSLALSSLPIASTVSAEVNDPNHPEEVPEVYEDCAERFQRVINAAVLQMMRARSSGLPDVSVTYPRENLIADKALGERCITHTEAERGSEIGSIKVSPNHWEIIDANSTNPDGFDI